jgi:biopolymer transport protein ExbB
MRRCFVVIALAGCSFSPGHATQVDGGSIDARIDGSIDASTTSTTTLSIALGNTTELDNFPLLVPLTGSALDYSKVGDPTTGFSFLQNGAPLFYDVDHWDPNGRSALWVRVPVIVAGSPTQLMMNYGANEGSASPLQTWNGYTQVLHFDTAAVDDSVGAEFTPTPTDITVQAGQIGNAAGFVPSSSITFQNGDKLYNHYAAFTLQFWINPAVTDQLAPVMEQGSPLSDAYYDSSGSDFSINLAFANAGEDVAQLPVDGGVWNHLALTWDGTTVTGYANGVPMYQSLPFGTPTTLDASSGDSFLLGDVDDEALTGALDELELEQTSHDADWIAASHVAELGSAITFTRQ